MHMTTQLHCYSSIHPSITFYIFIVRIERVFVIL